MNRASLTQLTVGGFQSLRGRVDIPIAPLTFLFGPNSAGKSTLIDAVRLFRLLTSPIPPSREMIAETNTVRWRDVHKDAVVEDRRIVLGAEVEFGELPALGQDGLGELAFFQGTRMQLEIEAEPFLSRPSLRVFVDGELLFAREAEKFHILLDANLRLPTDPGYAPSPSEDVRPWFLGTLRINVGHAAWKGKSTGKLVRTLTRWTSDAESPEVRACLRGVSFNRCSTSNFPITEYVNTKPAAANPALDD